MPLIKQMRMQCPIAFPGDHTRMPKRVKACIKPNANGDMNQPLNDIHDQSLHQHPLKGEDLTNKSVGWFLQAKKNSNPQPPQFFKEGEVFPYFTTFSSEVG